MTLTKLTTKGQVVIPKEYRARLGWKPGTKLRVTETDDGIVLRPLPTKQAIEEWIKSTMGSIKHGDPVGDLERDHREEIERDARRLREMKGRTQPRGAAKASARRRP